MVTLEKIMHVHFHSLTDKPSLDYYFDTTEDYPGMFEYLKTQLRLRVGLSGPMVFRGVDLSDGAYILHDYNTPMYLVTFKTQTLVEL